MTLIPTEQSSSISLQSGKSYIPDRREYYLSSTTQQ
jgi:hypothetical protein